MVVGMCFLFCVCVCICGEHKQTPNKTKHKEKRKRWGEEKERKTIMRIQKSWTPPPPPPNQSINQDLIRENKQKKRVPLFPNASLPSIVVSLFSVSLSLSKEKKCTPPPRPKQNP